MWCGSHRLRNSVILHLKKKKKTSFFSTDCGEGSVNWGGGVFVCETTIHIHIHAYQFRVFDQPDVLRLRKPKDLKQFYSHTRGPLYRKIDWDLKQQTSDFLAFKAIRLTTFANRLDIGSKIFHLKQIKASLCDSRTSSFL